MKKLKISMIAVTAIVLAITLSAFTSERHEGAAGKSPKIIQWYEFDGNPNSLTELQDEDFYSYDGGSKPCNGTSNICGVRTTGSTVMGDSPDPFSSTLKATIQNVKNNPSQHSADVAELP